MTSTASQRMRTEKLAAPVHVHFLQHGRRRACTGSLQGSDCSVGVGRNREKEHYDRPDEHRKPKQKGHEKRGPDRYANVLARLPHLVLELDEFSRPLSATPIRGHSGAVVGAPVTMGDGVVRMVLPTPRLLRVCPALSRGPRAPKAPRALRILRALQAPRPLRHARLHRLDLLLRILGILFLGPLLCFGILPNVVLAVDELGVGEIVLREEERCEVEEEVAKETCRDEDLVLARRRRHGGEGAQDGTSHEQKNHEPAEPMVPELEILVSDHGDQENKGRRQSDRGKCAQVPVLDDELREGEIRAPVAESEDAKTHHEFGISVVRKPEAAEIRELRKVPEMVGLDLQGLERRQIFSHEFLLWER
mmetsp:Transcript_107199/g.301690  ORF Transcript_107199/g.301690 Transcript_107199/m.301690 type:complete len:363 (-) Transcript_107199:648-1736(-)